MKNILRFAGVALFVAILPFSACKKDDKKSITCTAQFVNDSFLTLVDDLNTAVTLYNANPNSANCNRIADALTEYKNFLEDYRDCGINTLGYTQVEWELLLQEVQNEIENLNC